MPHITDILCAIERRADRAIAQELRLMAQEILAMRTHLSLDHRAHADALLLKLDHLERYQQVEAARPLGSCVMPAAEETVARYPRIEMVGPEPPSHFLVHFYDHETGNLDRVELTETLPAAAQLVRQHLARHTLLLWQVTQCITRGTLAFLSGDDRVLASIVPCEPSSPDVEPLVAQACATLVVGNPAPLRQLFGTPLVPQPARWAA